MMQVWTNPPQEISQIITGEELELIRKEAMDMAMPKAVLEELSKLRRSVHEANIFVSDRKWVQIGRILRAYAYLQGSSEVLLSHFAILADVLWHDPEQRSEINKLLAPYLARKQTSLADIENKLEEVYRQFKSKEVEPTDTFIELKDISRQLNELNKSSKDPRVSELIERLAKYNNEVSTEGLNL